MTLTEKHVLGCFSSSELIEELKRRGTTSPTECLANLQGVDGFKKNAGAANESRQGVTAALSSSMISLDTYAAYQQYCEGVIRNGCVPVSLAKWLQGWPTLPEYNNPSKPINKQSPFYADLIAKYKAYCTSPCRGDQVMGFEEWCNSPYDAKGSALECEYEHYYNTHGAAKVKKYAAWREDRLYAQYKREAIAEMKDTRAGHSITAECMNALRESAPKGSMRMPQAIEQEATKYGAGAAPGPKYEADRLFDSIKKLCR